MINKDNYFNEINRIGESNLPEELREAHSLVLRATENGKNWEGITPKVNEVINLQMQKLDNFLKDKAEATTKEKKPTRTRKKQPAPTPDSEKKEKTLVKVNRVRTKALPKRSKYTRPIVKVVRKTVKQAKPPKAPVSVKKYSLELQHIKRFAHLHGKDHKISTLKSFLKTIENHIAADDYLNHRSMITEIATRLAKGLEAAQGSSVMAVTIEPAFREKVQDLVANAKVRMRTEFLAGINSEKRSQKQP